VKNITINVEVLYFEDKEVEGGREYV